MSVELGFDVHGPDGAPWLFLGPSLGSTRQMWDGLLPALAQRFRVVRYDHRGHGGSGTVPGPYQIEDLGGDVLALADRLGARRFHLAGLSLGGMVGMWVAAHAPDRVDRLALLCTSAYLPPAEGWHDRAAAVRAGGTSAVAEAVVARWFTPGWAARHPEQVAAATAMVSGIGAEGYAGCCEAIAALDLRPDLPRITAPTLVIAAADDPATPPEHAHLIADAVPGARTAVIEGASHLAAVQAAAECAELILDHLTNTPQAELEARLDPAGLAVRREVLGASHVTRSLAGADSFTADFQEFITRYAWGGVWTRDGLDRRTRSCITLAVLTALHCTEELPLHVRGALNNGLTPDEIKEVLLHTAVYAGVPAANSAFAVARRALDEASGSPSGSSGPPFGSPGAGVEEHAPGGGVPGTTADPADLNT